MLRRLWGVAPVMTTHIRVHPENFNSLLSKAAITAFDEYITSPGNGLNVSDHQHLSVASTANDYVSSSGRRRRRRCTSTSPMTKHSIFDTNHASILSRNEDTSTSSALTHNDYFFEHQRTRGYRLATPSIASCEAALRLQDEVIATEAIKYLEAIGGLCKTVDSSDLSHSDNANNSAYTASLQLAGGQLSIDMWAAVQRGKGAYHADHVHDGVIVSGVYYAAIPPHSAPLVLRYPKTRTQDIAIPISDFGGVSDKESSDDVVIHPTEGLLILFPPWLMHGVPIIESDGEDYNCESHNTLPRVSYAFNIGGSFTGGDPWDVTRIPHIAA